MRYTPLGVLLLALILAGAGVTTAITQEDAPRAADGLSGAISAATVTPTPTAVVHLPAIQREGYPPPPTPTPTPDTRSPMEVCLDHPDRYNWRPYALAAGFPEWSLDELAYVILVESRGDLCAVNSWSGATCWIQQYPGGDGWLDPERCMAQGFAKWEDGGRSFERHWYRFW